MNLFIRAFNSNWVFSRPQKKEILIYDSISKNTAKYLFHKTECEVLNVRYETINIFILLLTIFSSGFKNIQDNYKINYIKYVAPKIVFSTFTYNPAFFKLKSLYSNSIYISLLISACDERFFKSCDDFYKKNPNIKLKSDYLFVVGQYYKAKMEKYIDTKIFNIGSIKNNFYQIKRGSQSKKKNTLLFVSQIYALKENEITSEYKLKIDNEQKIVKSLDKYCKRNNLELKISTRNKKNALDFYKNKFGEGNWTIYPNVDDSTSYNLVNESFFIIFTNSFLGLEALSKGKKCVAFPPEEFPIQRFGKTFSNQGPFWSLTFNEKIMKNYIEKILSYDEDTWRKIVDQNVGDLVKYNPGNSILKKNFKRT